MVEENMQEWEQSLTERVGAILAQRVNPLHTELERLEQRLSVLRGGLATSVSEDEQAALTVQVRDLISTAVRHSEQRAEARLIEEVEKARATISANLRQTLEEDFERRLAQVKADAQEEMQAHIADLQSQLASASVVAATAAVASAPTSTNNYPAFKAAVEDIDAQRTQSETLTALIRGAAQFAPRIAFFVVKSGDAVGWKAAGFQNGLNDETVRSLVVSTQKPSLLSQALSSQTAAIALNPPASEIANLLGSYGDLTPRGAVAVPLVVRGKAAAVLYADSADGSDEAIQLEAIETLVYVAGMSIELLPSRRNAEPARPATPVPQAAAPTPAPTVEAPAPVLSSGSMSEPPATPVSAPAVQPVVPAAAVEEPSIPFTTNPGFASSTDPVPSSPQPAPVVEPVAQVAAPAESGPNTAPFASTPRDEAETLPSLHAFEANISTPEEDGASPVPDTDPFKVSLSEPVPASPPSNSTNSLDAPTWMRRLESPSLASTPEAPAPPPMQKPSLANWGAKERTPEKPATVQSDVPSVKLSDKIPNFNAPSEPPRYAAPSLSVSTAASETEVRAHNDARRFARLLVSEIKLYNAAKVNEGRRNGDLYDRLRDEVDRSRKVYDKRVSPTVAAKFDYFYDELVQTLAEGDPSKLGENCPGPFVVAS